MNRNKKSKTNDQFGKWPWDLNKFSKEEKKIAKKYLK